MVVIDKKWQCPECNWTSSRRWNMARHIKLRHGVQLNPIKTDGDAQDSFIPRGFQMPKFENDARLYKGTDKSEDPVTDLLEWMQNYYIPLRSFISTHNPPLSNRRLTFHHCPTVDSTFHRTCPQSTLSILRIKNTSSNYWNMPIADVQGVSGYFCKACNIFSSRLIRDIGCDRTEKSKHTDLHVIKSKQTGLQVIDVDAPLNSITVAVLRNALNFIMPGIKYGLSLDLTDFYAYLSSKLDPIIVLNLIGVPDRWYLCSVEKGLQWLERIIKNVGNKVRLEESEVTDFLRRAGASYAIFDIQTETTFRYFAIWITS